MLYVRAEFADGFFYEKEYPLDESRGFDFGLLIKKHGNIVRFTFDY